MELSISDRKTTLGCDTLTVLELEIVQLSHVRASAVSTLEVTEKLRSDCN